MKFVRMYENSAHQSDIWPVSMLCEVHGHELDPSERFLGVCVLSVFEKNTHCSQLDVFVCSVNFVKMFENITN